MQYTYTVTTLCRSYLDLDRKGGINGDFFYKVFRLTYEIYRFAKKVKVFCISG